MSVLVVAALVGGQIEGAVGSDAGLRSGGSASCSWRSVLPLESVIQGARGHVTAVSATGPSDVWVGVEDLIKVSSTTTRSRPLLVH